MLDSKYLSLTLKQRKSQAQLYLKCITSFKNRHNQKNEDVYAINKEWLNNWKKYVDYEFIKRKYIPIKDGRYYTPKEVSFKKYDVNDMLIKTPKSSFSLSLNGDQFLDKSKSHSNKFLPKKLMILFHSQFHIDCFKLFKPKTVTIPYGLYPIKAQCKITPSIQSYSTQLSLDQPLVFNYFGYYRNNFNYLAETIRKNKDYQNSYLTFWKYLKDNRNGHNDEYTRQPIVNETLIKDTDSNDLIVCEHQPINNDQYKAHNNSIEKLASGSKGAVGLNNLGNTCFMASGLQCLSNCDYLTEYFLKYYNENRINTVNEDGTYGKLSNAYYMLLVNLWQSNNSSYSPYDFKSAIGSFNSLFKGYSQQDSFELLTSSLNGISEDINLVQRIDPNKAKDIKEPKEDAEDCEIAKFKREKNSSRRQSVIIDLFYGMYKSILYCPQGCIIKVFEAFHSFQVPLNVYFITCVFVYFDLSIQPIEIKIPFESDKKYGHLRREISEIFDVNEDSFVFADVDDDGKIIQLNNAERLVKKESTVHCYQIDPQITKNAVKTQSLKYKPKDEIERVMKKVFSCLEYRERKLIPFYSTKLKDKIRAELDNYYNLDDKYVLLILNINMAYQKTSSIQRLLFVDKTITLPQLNDYIKSYLSPLSSNLSKSIYCSLNNSSVINSSINTQYTNTTNSQSTMSDSTNTIFDSKITTPSLIEDSTTTDPIYKLNLTINNKCPLCHSIECTQCNISNHQYTQLSHLFKPQHPLSINSYLYIDKDERKFISEDQFDSFEVTVTYKDTTEELKWYMLNPERLSLPNEDNAHHLEYCIKEFQTVHGLLGQWRCSNCGNVGLAKKGMYVYSCSNYLIIQMKRFKDTMKSKYTKLITFPIYGLDMSPYVVEKDKNLVYDLIGVINHYGSFDGGHYIAYAKNCIDGKWREFNDSHVSLMNESDVITNAAYVLFYKKRNIEQEFDKESCFNRCLLK